MNASAASGAGNPIDVTHRVEQRRTTLSLEYSQFVMDFSESAVVGLSWQDPSGLAFLSDLGRVVLATVRQFGRVPVEVHVFEQVPLVDPSWADVVEFSVEAVGPLAVDSWESSADGVSVALRAGVEYRVRFVIVDGEAGSQQYLADWSADPVEEYLLQLWPQAASGAAVVKNESPWAQASVLYALARTIAPVLRGVSRDARAAAVLLPALERYPMIERRIRGGNPRYRLGLLGYLSGLRLATVGDPDFAFLSGEADAADRVLNEYFS